MLWYVYRHSQHQLSRAILHLLVNSQKMWSLSAEFIMPILLLKLYKYAVVVGSCFPSDYSVAFIAVSDLCVTYFFNSLRFSRTREVLLFKIIFMCNMSSCSRRAIKKKKSRSRWSCGLRQRSAAARLLRSRVQISLRSWMFVSCVYCVMFR